MGVLTVREELKQVVDTLTDEQAAVLLQVARMVQPTEQNEASSDDWLDRAHRFRMRLEQKYGMLPDVVETLEQAWEERLNDIDSLR